MLQLSADRCPTVVKLCGSHRRPRFNPWRRKWQPTPVLLPGESHGQRSLVGYCPWGCKSQTGLMVHTHTHAHMHGNTVTLSVVPCFHRTRLWPCWRCMLSFTMGPNVPAQACLLHLSPSHVKDMPTVLYFYCSLSSPNHSTCPAPSVLCFGVHLSFEEILIKTHIPQNSSLGHTARSDIFRSVKWCLQNDDAIYSSISRKFLKIVFFLLYKHS